jgi:hypothetical protein
MLLTMKYVWIVVAVILIVRIDLILHTVDRAWEKFKSSPAEVRSSDIPEARVLLPSSGATLTPSSRSLFFTLLEDYHLNPEQAVRQRVISELKKNPQLLGEKLDNDFEASIYRLRDLVQQKNADVSLLLVDLLDLTKGENHQMIRRFLTLIMDRDIEYFLKVYQKTNDVNCMIASLIADRLPDEERDQIMFERQDKLKSYLELEKKDPELQNLAEKCLMVLNLEVSKLIPPEVNDEGQSP